MFDVGHRNGGATVVLATSHDQKYPPENMTDGKDDTFWATTGLFPQEFVIGFGNMMDVDRVTISSYNVRHLQIEKCSGNDATNFDQITTRDIPQTDGQLQVEDIEIRSKCTYLRFIIDSGYDHFVSIHKLNIAGNAVHG